MILDVPGKGLKHPAKAACKQPVAPGEEATVRFELVSRPASPLAWQQSVISAMNFQPVAAPPPAAR